MPEPFKSPTPQPERHAADSLPSAMLLAATGGGLDAFTYINHGRVFASAMTGNGVLLGVAVLHHDWPQAARHIVPLFAFILGVFLADALDGTFKDHAVALGLALEILVLFAASWFPGAVSDLIFIPFFAFAAAYQVASFRKADSYSYNSTFMTGNLRTAIDGLYEALHPATRQSGLKKCYELALIVASFMVGAIAGALLAPRFFNHTLWFVDLLLLAVLGLVVRRRGNQPASEAEAKG